MRHIQHIEHAVGKTCIGIVGHGLHGSDLVILGRQVPETHLLRLGGVRHIQDTQTAVEVGHKEIGRAVHHPLGVLVGGPVAEFVSGIRRHVPEVHAGLATGKEHQGIRPLDFHDVLAHTDPIRNDHRVFGHREVNLKHPGSGAEVGPMFLGVVKHIKGRAEGPFVHHPKEGVPPWDFGEFREVGHGLAGVQSRCHIGVHPGLPQFGSLPAVPRGCQYPEHQSKGCPHHGYTTVLNTRS